MSNADSIGNGIINLHVPVGRSPYGGQVPPPGLLVTNPTTYETQSDAAVSIQLAATNPPVNIPWKASLVA